MDVFQRMSGIAVLFTLLCVVIVSSEVDVDVDDVTEYLRDASSDYPQEEGEQLEEVQGGDLKTSSTNFDPQLTLRLVKDDERQSKISHPATSLYSDQGISSVGSLFGRPYNRPTGSRLPPVSSVTSRPIATHPYNHPPVIAVGQPHSNDHDTVNRPNWNLRPNQWDSPATSIQQMNMTKVQHIDAECQNDYMKIRVRFNSSFSGMIYSTGFAHDPLCVYINGTGRDYYEFYIQLNRCGTLGGNTHNALNRKHPSKNFMWNTLSIQYSTMIEEEWDEHYKVTCEYGNDYWKTVTFPFLDVEVATGNPLTFTLTPPECHMEIREGHGTTGIRVAGPVRVGDPITLVVYMRSELDGFDMIVNNCYAHNGANKKIQLIDDNGCPINEKLISRFRGTWSDSGLYETQVFAYMKAFRFTGSPALYIECDVRMCHGHCPIQPCYWRDGHQLTKRSSRSADARPENTTLSENLNLFQSIQVVTDDEFLSNSSFVQRNALDSDQVCLKPLAVGAVIGLSVVVCMVMTIVSCMACLQLRQRKETEKLFYQDSHRYHGNLH